MENREEKKQLHKKRAVRSARESAYIAVFTALLIAVQLAFAAVPGVELVTVLFVAYAFVFGVIRGVAAATAFSLLRQLVFGFMPTVLIVYLIYYTLLASLFGVLGKRMKQPLKYLWLIVLIACLCTVCFTLLDNLITPLWLGYTRAGTRLYFKASLAFMIPQVLCAAVTVGCLFYPLYKVFRYLKK